MITRDIFWGRVNKNGPVLQPELGPCWEWTGYRAPTPKNYGRASWQAVLWMAHRLAWFLTHGAIPKGMKVLHKCDNPPCCNPNHLFLGSDQDNVTDCTVKGRRNTTHNAVRKLSTEAVMDIRALYATRKRGIVKFLASKYGVCKGTIHGVTHYRYKDI